MMFAFRKKKEDGLIYPHMGHYPFYSYDQLLAYDICYEVFLRGMDVVGEPENTNFVEKGKNDVVDRLIDALCQNVLIQHLLKMIDIQLDHMRDQVVYNPFLLGFE